MVFTTEQRRGHHVTTVSELGSFVIDPYAAARELQPASVEHAAERLGVSSRVFAAAPPSPPFPAALRPHARRKPTKADEDATDEARSALTHALATSLTRVRDHFREWNTSGDVRRPRRALTRLAAAVHSPLMAFL